MAPRNLSGRVRIEYAVLSTVGRLVRYSAARSGSNPMSASQNSFDTPALAEHHRLVRFSIITPSYRSSRWLKLCVASVADQGVELEHIVQDAGSDDGTLDWLPQDKRVKAFVENDQGMYDAVNRGLCRSTGDLLAYLNCDEQYLPGALAAVRPV